MEVWVQNEIRLMIWNGTRRGRRGYVSSGLQRIQCGVEGFTRAHGGGDEGSVGAVVASDVHGDALTVD